MKLAKILFYNLTLLILFYIIIEILTGQIIFKKKLKWKSKIKIDKGLSQTLHWYLKNKGYFSSVSKKLYNNRLGLKVESVKGFAMFLNISEFKEIGL